MLIHGPATPPTYFAATREYEMGNDERVVAGEIVRSERGAEIDPLTIIEQRGKLMDRLLEAAIRATHSGQWVAQGDKPFPTAAAAEVMARRCGVRVFDVASKREERNDEDGPSYIYFTTGKAQLGNSEYDVIEAIGTCSSRDQFLGTETGAGRKLSEVDEGNISKASYSNFLVNVITRLLGVRNMTWDQLARYGVTKDGAASVTYKTGAQGGGSRDSSASGSMEIKFGKSKGKTLSEVGDDDLAWYMAAFERDFNDPEKSKYKANAEKQLNAAKAEAAKRANAKSNVAPKTDTAPGYWDRLKLLATQQGVPEDKLKTVTRQILKKPDSEPVRPGDLTEAEFKSIADALEVVAKDIAEKAKKADF